MVEIISEPQQLSAETGIGHSIAFEPNIDQLLKNIVQPCGLWQWMVTLLLMLSSTSIATFPVYANSASPHRCRMEPHIEQFIQQNNLSFTHVASRIGPWDDATTNGTLLNSKDLGCFRYRSSWLAKNSVVVLGMSSSEDWTDRELERCPFGFVFEESNYHYPGTVVAEFATVCERDWLVPTGTTLFILGLVIGTIVSGWLGDHIGRKKTIILFSGVELLSGLWTTLSPDYVNYVLSRMAMGIGNQGKASTASVLLLEITTAKYRSVLLSVYVLGTTFVYRSILALWAHLIPDWRLLNLAALSPHLFTSLYFCCLPESPRWLISQGRTQEALKVLKKGYIINYLRQAKPELQTLEDLSESLLANAPKTGRKLIQSLQSLRPPSAYRALKCFRKPFATPYLIQTTLSCTLLLASLSTTIFGLLFYARILRGYVCLIGFVYSMVALPAAILTAVLYRFIRYRKRPLIILIGITSCVLAIGAGYTVIWQPTEDIVLIVCSNLALLLITSTVGMCNIYVPELFPSDVRASGFGIAAGLGRVLSMTCTFVNELDNHTPHGTPLLIYSGLLLIGLIVLLTASETSGENLRDYDEPTHVAAQGEGEHSYFIGSTYSIDEHSLD
ncbi:hypothetical protein EG68_04571 [Paragonimus skrjabini miyazakii]|uniref:Major facilitator superfamily (MFS) profile domain-containing protein n=1 Tax=Paragonimus skrjabini miyazakii TaxID=59628 RepID=A0A8S9YT60_9TREM|nr:hypothetical protein EG68_04571 [Paragonimus skrjabini miyazakii]